MKEFQKFVNMTFSDYVEDNRTKAAKSEFMTDLEFYYQTHLDQEVKHSQAVANSMMNFTSDKDYFSDLDIKPSIIKERQNKKDQYAKLDPFIDYINNFNWILTVFAIVIYIAVGLLTVHWYKLGWPIIPLAIITDYIVTKNHKSR